MSLTFITIFSIRTFTYFDRYNRWFQACNSKFKNDFEFSFNLSLSDFYDFPFHPLVLDHSSYLLYCKLAEQKTRCYIDQCNDLSADSTFSPANFICAFKRNHFTGIRFINDLNRCLKLASKLEKSRVLLQKAVHVLLRQSLSLSWNAISSVTMKSLRRDSNNWLVNGTPIK